MAKRIRNYKAEEARRNALARQRGFTSRAAERGAKKRADYQRAGFASHADYIKARQEAQSWSDIHSHVKSSEYNRKFTPEQLRLYMRAYGLDDSDEKARRESLALFLSSVYSSTYPDIKDSEYWAVY